MCACAYLSASYSYMWFESNSLCLNRSINCCVVSRWWIKVIAVWWLWAQPLVIFDTFKLSVWKLHQQTWGQPFFICQLQKSTKYRFVCVTKWMCACSHVLRPCVIHSNNSWYQICTSCSRYNTMKGKSSFESNVSLSATPLSLWVYRSTDEHDFPITPSVNQMQQFYMFASMSIVECNRTK